MAAMPAPPFRDELSVALAAAHAAGDIIRGHYQRGPIETTVKADGTPVTQADLEANQAIVAALRAAFPDDGILAEETADDRSRLVRERVWIVDPMDGTRDFVQRSGQFAVHIALALRGAPVVGVVYSPIERLTYHAVAGHGACIDSAPLAVSSASASACRASASTTTCATSSRARSWAPTRCRSARRSR